MRVYCTTYCNFGHRVSDGMPVGHECRILPPAALVAEVANDIPRAIEILNTAPTVYHRGVRARKG
jgi:hypothetical protein